MQNSIRSKTGLYKFSTLSKKQTIFLVSELKGYDIYEDIKIEADKILYDYLKKYFKIKIDVVVICNNSLCFSYESIKDIQSRLNPQNLYFTILSLEEVVNYYLVEDAKLRENISTLEIASNENVKVFNTNRLQWSERLSSNEDTIKDLLQQQKYIYNPYRQQEQSKIKTPSLEQERSSIMERLINQKQGELTRIKNKSLQVQSSAVSELIERQSQCHFCQQNIIDNLIYLECNHQYHEECLYDLITSQLIEKPIQLVCLCKVKIAKKAFGNILDRMFVDNFLFQLAVNELMHIKRNAGLQFMNCKNKHCYFFYVNEGNNNISYCPICLK